MSPEVSGTPENLDVLYKGRFEEGLGPEQYEKFSAFLSHEVRLVGADRFAIRLTSIVDEGPFYTWILYKIHGSWDGELLFEAEGMIMPAAEEKESWLAIPDRLVAIPTFIPDVSDNNEELYG